MRITTTFTSFSLLAFFLFAGLLASAQPISTFPYVADFDTFPQATQGQIAEPNPDNFPGDWGNVNGVDLAPDDDGPQDWYAVSGSTPSGSTGPIADHTSGSGRYLYVEDSGGGANNDTVSLITPIFNIGGLTNPSMSVFIHSNVNEAGRGFGGDSSYNDLKVEVFSAGSWTIIDSIGALNTGWTEFVYDLSSYGSIVRFRFRVNNNNFGDFVHDIAIDDFRVFDFPDVDGAITDAGLILNAPAGYTLAPISQGPSYTVGGTIQNRGRNTLNDLKIVAEYGGGAYQDSISIDSLQSLQFDSFLYGSSLVPTAGGPVDFTLTSLQNDTFPANNTRSAVVIDSVFARDDSVAEGGLGFTGATGQFGNMFTLTQADRLTSSSFFLNSSTIGDTIRVLLYSFGNQIAGEPDTLGGLLDSTDYVVISQLGWNTLPFKCQPELDAGQYFIAVEQVNLNNLGFGYDLDNFSPGVTFFGDGINRWVDYAGLPASLQGYNLIRMNFGPETAPQTMISVTGGAGCEGDTVSLNGGTGLASYAWTGQGLLSNSGADVMATSTVTGSFTYTVVGTDANGCVTTDSLPFTFDPLPNATITNDTTICAGQSATLTASGGSTYSWDNGASTPMISVSPSDTTSYTATVFIGNCGVDVSTTVSVPEVSVSVDMITDVACNGDSTGAIDVSSVAPGSVTYTWDDGGSGANRTGLTAGTYIVTVTDDGTTCTATDTASISEAPAITLTTAVFGATNGNSDGYATIDASGGTPPFMYMWNDGQTADTAVNLAAGMYTVIVTDDNGCVDSATVNVNEYGVGINDLLDAAQVQVYPNPNQGRFVVRGLDALGAGEEILLSLHDLSGREVMRKVSIAQDEVEVNLSRDFMGGIYLLHVQSEDLRVVKRVVINP